MEYVKEEELLKEVFSSKERNAPTEELKIIFYKIIEHFLQSNKFRGYDEETKDIMRIKAYEFLTLYYKNFTPYRDIFHIEADKEKIKNILDFLNPKKIRKAEERKVKVSTGDEKESSKIEKILEKKRIPYKKERTKNKAFAYLSQITKSAFLQVIKKSNFKYVVNSSKQDNLNVVQINDKNMRTEGRNDISELYEITGKNETANDETEEISEYYYAKIKKIIEKADALKNKIKEKKQKKCIFVKEVFDINPVIKTIMEESDNFDDFIFLLNFFYEEGEIKVRSITSNPTIFYILKKFSLS